MISDGHMKNDLANIDPGVLNVIKTFTNLAKDGKKAKQKKEKEK